MIKVHRLQMPIFKCCVQSLLHQTDEHRGTRLSFCNPRMLLCQNHLEEDEPARASADLRDVSSTALSALQRPE